MSAPMYIVKAHSLLAISKARREARKQLEPVVKKVPKTITKSLSLKIHPKKHRTIKLEPVVEKVEPVVEKVEPVVEKYSMYGDTPRFYKKYKEDKEWYINDFINEFYTDGEIIDLLCKRCKSGYDKKFNYYMDLEHTASAYLDMYINKKKNGEDIIKRLGWYDTWSYKSFKENYVISGIILKKDLTMTISSYATGTIKKVLIRLKSG